MARELNLKAVIVENGVERDLFAMDEKERKEIGTQLAINFFKSLGCEVRRKPVLNEQEKSDKNELNESRDNK
ncbi:hypothetical protein C8E03_11751 [Lachnotalea glycerini]|uniref:Uncharacterized protein n=1 Tax=Lachnotalea glycerini TaxID=1763509 RepID=A0A318EJK4_9FIRM|nr:hypothetical protein [Lachnotalea glycerini]PXV85415.1 hypothetical protein C8E03_11751 [Lachnotalea glycerini]